VKQKIGILIVILAASIAASPSLGEEAAGKSDPAPMLPVLQPSQTHILPGDTSILDLEIAPDGEHLWAHLLAGRINVWAAFIQYWPEYIAILLGLVLLIAALRLARRRYVLGEPHCRRCGYPLTNHPGDQCPECGTILSRRGIVIGRSRARRFVVLGALAIALAGAWSIGREYAPRTGGIAAWRPWLSAGLHHWAWRHRHQWLLDHEVKLVSTVELDPATGSIVHVLCQRDDDLYRFAISPGGKTFYRWNVRRVEQCDARTGDVIATMSLDDDPLTDSPQDSLRMLVPSRDGRSALLGTSLSASIQRWTPQTGELAELMRIERIDGVPSFWARDLAAPNRIGLSTWTGDPEWRFDILDERTGETLHRYRLDVPTGRARTELSPDESRAYITDWNAGAVYVVDMSDGSLLETIDAPRRNVLSAQLSAGGRLLVVGSPRPAEVLVYDLQRGEWIASLAVPAARLISVHPMPDERTIVVRAWTGKQLNVDRFFVYDLTELQPRSRR
jgi:hypothetical protein